MDMFFAPSTWAAKEKTVSDLPKCGACGLYKTCHTPKMPVEGAGKRSILVVGDAPEQTDDDKGSLFVGKAGLCLRDMFADAGLDLDQCWMTNAAICRPPEDKLLDIHIESCLPNLVNTIKKLKPKVIILLGLSAVQSLIGTEWGRNIGTMARWDGWTIPSAKYGAWLCPIVHPSYVVAENCDPMLTRMVVGHLKRAAVLEHVPPVSCDLDAMGKAVDIITSPRLARLRLQDLAQKKGLLAWDYETTGLKPERPEQEIVTVSFCLDGVDTFACPVTSDLYDAIIPILQNDKLLKIASNLKFEDRWTRTKMGVAVRGWHWDTMLAAHVVDNRSGITSVKFQTYIHLGVGSYASWVDDNLKADYANDLNQVKKVHIEDLLRYNGIDSIVEYKIMEVQKEQLSWI